MPKKEAAAAPALTAALLALIAEREEILRWLEPAKLREMELRKQLAAALIPSPVEGANRLVTADGYEVILNHKINRKLDEAALDAVMLELPEDAPARTPGILIQYKPSLVISGYRNLPADQLKIVQQAITESEGAPELDIIKQHADIAPPGAANEPTMIDRSAGKPKDGTLGHAINKAHAKEKPAKKAPAKKKK